MITGDNLFILEVFYRRNKRPSRTDYEVLAMRTCVPKNMIRKWFQNRRYRERRMLIEAHKQIDKDVDLLLESLFSC